MVEDLKQMRTRLDGLKTQRAKDEGALEQTMKRLKEEFGCTTLEQARTLYGKLKRENEETASGLDTQAEQLDGLLTAMEQDAAGR